MPMILNGRIKEEDFDQDYFESTRYYYKVDETLINAPVVPSWCSSCNKIVDSELLPSVEAIDERIRRYNSGELDKFLNLNDKKRSKEIEKLELFKDLRNNRIERAKCLVCSSYKITELNEPDGYSPEYPPGKTLINFKGEKKELLLYMAGHINLKNISEVILDKNGNRA